MGWGELHTTGGPLTQEDLLGAASAVLNRTGRRPNPIITSIGTVKAGRRQARAAADVAFWLDAQRDRTPRWRWIRRRWMLRQAAERAGLALMLWNTFGDGE